MTDPVLFQSLTLQGFRAYLQPKTFDFRKKRCLAIFAPNGSGKSSVIDALEFLFSAEGTLDRLGQRARDNKAGPAALAHYGAEAASIEPVVKFTTITGPVTAEGSRAASGRQRPIHAVATTMSASFAVAPIIRGYTLRSFVEDDKPEGRYTDVAGWLQLSPLVEVQKNLRALRKDLKATAEKTTERDRLNGILRKETADTIDQWDVTEVLAYINNTLIAPLDQDFRFEELNSAAAAYADLGGRVEAEDNRLGLASLKQLKNAAEALWQSAVSDEDDQPIITGSIPDFHATVVALANARSMEADERTKAADIMFALVWKEAEPLFAEDTGALDNCPVCETPIDQTAAGNISAIRSHLAKKLGDLKTYSDAKKALELAEAAAKQAHSHMIERLGMLGELLEGDGNATLKGQLITYKENAAKWPTATLPDSEGVTDNIAILLQSINDEIEKIEAKQGDRTWGKAKLSIDRILALQDEIALAVSTSAELVELNAALIKQASFISSKIRDKVQSLLDTLQTPMNEIYKEIQGDRSAPIRLQLPGEDDANQQRLELLIDFSENRTGVKPSGYLSDSQIHSVALALRLAAIKQFNSGAPVIALDDIVTSYDADHRRAVSGLLAKMFSDCQIMLVTHDERFFNYLKDQLPEKNWQFTRIIGLDPSYGPRFADHKIADEMVEARWESGQSAANEMRQAEEEWLLSIARGFRVDVSIRPLEKPYSYDRGELAFAIAGFLKKIRISPPDVSGVDNRFLSSLGTGVIENFGSHFQDVPYGDGSIGDEKTRWKEFKSFRSQFSCPACKRTKFKKPFGLNKPVCAHAGCETPFAFSQTDASTSNVE